MRSPAHAITVSNLISGGGSLTQAGTGTVILTGTNTYTGGTTAFAGLINFAIGDNLGTGNITLDGGGLQWAADNTLDISSRLNMIGFGGATFDTNGNDVTFASLLSGPGGITKAGEGTLILTADNAYGGSTTVSGGTLRVGDGGTSGTLGAGDINVFGGTLVFDRADNVTYANDLNMYGTLVQAGAGTVTLQGSNFVQGAIRLDGGLLNLESSVFFDEGSLLTFNGGSLRQAVDQTWDGFLSLRWRRPRTPSALSVADGSTLTIYSSMSVENGVNGNPTLRFGTATDTGTIILNSAANFTPDGSGALIVQGGTLATDFDNDILNVLATGLGVVEIRAPGILDLSGGAAFTDFQYISSLIGAGTLTNDSTTRIAAGTFSGSITGAGGIEKIGPGTLTLTGFNSYTGTTSVLGGTLEVDATGLFGTSLVEIGNGAMMRALTAFTDRRDSRSWHGGGTIDTGAGIVSIFGGIDFGGTADQAGGGLLISRRHRHGRHGNGGIDVLSGTLGLGRRFRGRRRPDPARQRHDAR